MGYRIHAAFGYFYVLIICYWASLDSNLLHNTFIL